MMDCNKQKQERLKIEAAECAKLLALTDEEAKKLTYSWQYQRIRYFREIEAAEWLTEIRKNIKLQFLDKNTSNRYKIKGKLDYQID